MHWRRSRHQRRVRAAVLTESPHVPVTPVPAASVILLRETEANGVELFMARRHIKSDFAPDVYVFPGGKADAGDAIPGNHVSMPELPTLRDRHEPALGWRAIFMAAIRELFEETGLLLARTADGQWIQESTGIGPEEIGRLRAAVRAGDLSMAQLSEQSGVSFAADDLKIFANWITPEVLTRRFDTFFFLAQMPHVSEARLADELELTHAVWIKPSKGLERFKAGEFPLVYATERLLEQLARYSSIQELWQAFLKPIETISPRWYLKDGERVFVIPGDEGYESARGR